MEESCFYFVKKWDPELLQKHKIRSPYSRNVARWWAIVRSVAFFTLEQCVEVGALELFFKGMKLVRQAHAHKAPDIRVTAISTIYTNAIHILYTLKDKHRTNKLANVTIALETFLQHEKFRPCNVLVSLGKSVGVAGHDMVELGKSRVLADPSRLLTVSRRRLLEIQSLRVRAVRYAGLYAWGRVCEVLG